MSNNQVQKYQAIQYFQCAKISPLIIAQTPIVLPSKQSPVLQTGLSSNKHRKGFTILEVLISISILVLTLMVLYQSFSTSLFVLSSTTNLWKAMSHAQNELLKSERATNAPPVSFSQGEFKLEHPMNGFAWKKQILDTSPLPGIRLSLIHI